MTVNPPELDRTLRLHPITYLEENDEVMVGRADIDSYGLFPADGAALLRYLEAGHTPNEARRWYSETYDEQVDIVEFLEVLREFELIAAEGEEVPAAAPVRWQRLGRAVFSPVAWVGYAALVAAAAVAMARDHELVPTYQHLFFTQTSLVVLTLGIVLGQTPLILLHEAFHALAGRRLGLRSTLRIGRRFYYVVFETSLDGLVAVPRNQRYLPMLAGMVLDVLAVAGLSLAAGPLVHSTAAPAVLIGRLLLCMAFGVVLRLVWQFYFFLRTDLYFLVTTVLRCNDLQTVTRELLRNHVHRVLGMRERLVAEETWHPRDRHVARWYAWLLVVGYALLGGTLVFVALPTGIRLTESVFLKLGTDVSVANIADTAAFLVLNFGELALAGFLALRGLRRRPAAAAA